MVSQIYLDTELFNVEINFKPLRVATFECTIFLKFFDLKYSRTVCSVAKMETSFRR